MKENVTRRTKYLTKVAMLSVIAFLLMAIEFPLAFLFPEFLKIEIGNVPALLGGFSMGPLAGVLIVLMKNLLHMAFRGPTLVGFGQLANFIISSSSVLPACVIYRYMKNRRGALTGMGVGSLFMVVVASAANYNLLIPVYYGLLPLKQGFLALLIFCSSLFLPAMLIHQWRKTLAGASVGMAVGFVCMAAAVLTGYFGLVTLDFTNSTFTAASVLSMVLVSIAPFNLMRAVLESTVTYSVYKPLSPILHR